MVGLVSSFPRNIKCVCAHEDDQQGKLWTGACISRMSLRRNGGFSYILRVVVLGISHYPAAHAHQLMVHGRWSDCEVGHALLSQVCWDTALPFRFHFSPQSEVAEHSDSIAKRAFQICCIYMNIPFLEIYHLALKVERSLVQPLPSFRV